MKRALVALLLVTGCSFTQGFAQSMQDQNAARATNGASCSYDTDCSFGWRCEKQPSRAGVCLKR